ncbi:MAG: CDP-alcohol phosphatidyltransferase family protein [Deltaproteobacteria bacterium]|nr:CDP-alcohol phosphatidyltransferase family protein [Deltaproteobacteria bacterium]MBI4223872.1 CDP-alcohol phosphatidyltransferase family protein [Deltaproteobacteria bacterium]
MTLADVLTILRLILVPCFLWAFLAGEFMTAFWFFVAAGVTDLVDGSIARLTKQETELGAFLDPIADKALMVSTVTCLLLAQVIPWWFFGLVVARDLSILSGLAWFRFKKVSFELKPLWTSKMGTLVNIVLVVFAFLKFLQPVALFLGRPFSFWFAIFLALSTVLVVVSGCQYAYIGTRILRHGSTPLQNHP